MSKSYFQMGKNKSFNIYSDNLFNIICNEFINFSESINFNSKIKAIIVKPLVQSVENF